MSNSADRAIQKMFQSSGQSDLAASSLESILALLSAGGLVGDSNRPFAVVVAAIKQYVPDGSAKVSALQLLNSALQQENQS